MTAPFILALDISKTRTGICFGAVGSNPKFLSVSSAGEDDVRAMCRLGSWLIDFTKAEHIDRLFYEAAINPAAFMGRYDEEKGKVRMTSNPQTTIALAKMVGVVEFVAKMKGIPFDSAHVQSVRKIFLGQGRPANPKRCARLLCEKLGWGPSNDDEADAGAVWFYGCIKSDPHRATIITPMMQQAACSIGQGARAVQA